MKPEERYWIGLIYDHIRSSGHALTWIQQIAGTNACAWKRIGTWVQTECPANDDQY